MMFFEFLFYVIARLLVLEHIKQTVRTNDDELW